MKNKYLFNAYFIILHIIIILILAKSNFIPNVMNKIGVQKNEFSHYYHQMLAFHDRVDKNLTENTVLFIGDSHIQGLAVSSVISNSVNFGIGGDTTKGVINRLPYYTHIFKSKQVILAIGYNDLKVRSLAEIIENFQTILNFFPSRVHIVVSAVHPIDEEFVKISIDNEQIKALNFRVFQLSQEYENVTFISIAEDITTKGALSKKYHIGDGVHLNKAGYDVWITKLKIHLNE